MARSDGRGDLEVRPVVIEGGVLHHPEGSASIRMGRTWIVCTATVEERQPQFLKGTSSGWITAEYGMLPRSVAERTGRGRGAGRSAEIQRLIGRALRSVVDLEGMPLHTIVIDCDVIDADGGTRAASITCGFVALVRALLWMVRDGRIQRLPVREQVVGVSAGFSEGRLLVDMAYEEDMAASVDLTVAFTSSGRIGGLEAWAEDGPFEEDLLGRLIRVAREAAEPLFRAQRSALGLPPDAGFDVETLLPNSG